ncbi:MAG: hypothetical protein Q9O74_12475 [Planctomycetota bacterium]|nr:hypothetical protein [Planctomycetota bacterium]
MEQPLVQPKEPLQNPLHEPPHEPPQDQRQRVADFIHAHRDLIKEGFRTRITSGDRGFYDSSDFFSTVQRRADRLASLGDDESSRDILRTLHEIMLEALSDHAREMVRDRAVRESLAEDATRADQAAFQPQIPDGEPGLKALHLSAEELDLARLRAGGLLHRQVAAALGVSAAAVRMRWQRLVGKAEAAWEVGGQTGG